MSPRPEARAFVFAEEVAFGEVKTVNSQVDKRFLTLFLGGDVMLGRGIDQVLPSPGSPLLHEGYLKDARGYVEIAERVNGPIPRPVDFTYVWGEALRELEEAAPDLRLINLETAVTRCDQAWPKGINYRMNPANLPVLSAAGIDCCALANNHVLDWGYRGLEETQVSLDRAGIAHAGAGPYLREAAAPAVLEVPGKGRVLFFSCGSPSSGIPSSWQATPEKAGVNLIADPPDRTVTDIGERIRAVKRSGDVAVASIHWGGNWGYALAAERKCFAHRLVDEARVDLVHGHSSHHFQGIEVYRGKLILHGCGDLLNDYEGIAGQEIFRPDLVLIYLARIVPGTGTVASLRVVPHQIRNFRLRKACGSDMKWVRRVLSREGRSLGTRVIPDSGGGLCLQWGGRAEN